MLRSLFAMFALSLSAAGVPPTASAQGRPDPSALIAAQQQAMSRLAFLDGVWRGPAWIITPAGQRMEFTQTERVGPFLDGAVRVIEGRGYQPDSTLSFNALGIVSFDPATGDYRMRSYARGHVGDFTLTPTDDGFTWEIPAGPMTIRYTAVIREGTWKEVGDRIMPGGETVRFMEFTLTRAGDTDWPAAGAIAPR